MEYITELINTIKKQPIKIIYTSFLLWVALPIIIFGVWGILQVVFYMKLDINIFIKLFANALVPWWASILMNFKKFIAEYLLSFIMTTILVYHNILEPSNPN